MLHNKIPKYAHYIEIGISLIYTAMYQTPLNPANNVGTIRASHKTNKNVFKQSLAKRQCK